MKIGDLFFQARLDGSKIGMDAQKAGAQAGTKFGRAMQGPLAAQVKTGLGLGAGIGGFNIIATAITKVTGFLGDSADAFIAEERSVQKLSTALEANVKGWNGNTDAIEDVLQSRLTLGFSDDEQRESLALLVVATGDVTRALDIQRTAMDLARLKGISLAEASSALIKIEAGQFRALKALGIELPKNATQTEALAAVQAAAAGQAEDYAGTLEGKLLVAQVKVGEASEKFGESVARLQAEVLPAAADALGWFADGLEAIGDATDKTTPALEKQAAGIEVVRFLLAGFQPVDEWIAREEALAVTALEAAEAEEHHGDALIGVRQAVVDVTEATEDAEEPARDLATEFADLGRAAAAAEDEIDRLTDQLTQHLFGEAERAGQRAEITKRIDELRAKLKETADARDAVIIAGQIAEERVALMELDLQIATMAGGTALDDLLARWRKQFGKSDTVAQGMIQTLDTLIARQKTWKVSSLTGILAAGALLGGSIPRRHSGGPVEANKPYIWKPGEELLVTRQPGYVVPDMMGAGAGLAGLPSASDGASSVTNVNVQLPGLLRAESPADVVRTLRHLSAYGTFGEER